MSEMNEQNKVQQDMTAQEASVSVSVRVFPARGTGSTLAYATLELGGEYAVRGVRVVQGKDGPFVSMPHRQTKDDIKDYVYPVTKAVREHLTDVVLSAYEQMIEQEAKQAEEPGEPEQAAQEEE